MPFSGIVDPDQLAMLTKVLDDHCRAQGIYDDIDRDAVAERIVVLFQTGIQTAAELSAALAISDGALMKTRCPPPLFVHRHRTLEPAQKKFEHLV